LFRVALFVKVEETKLGLEPKNFNRGFLIFCKKLKIARSFCTFFSRSALFSRSPLIVSVQKKAGTCNHAIGTKSSLNAMLSVLHCVNLLLLLLMSNAGERIARLTKTNPASLGLSCVDFGKKGKKA